MKNLLIALFLISVLAQVQSQIAINSTGQNGDASAILDVQSTDKGLLVPRMTMSQRDGIVSPATGLLVFQIDETIGYYYYDGASWTSLGGAGGASVPSTGIIMSDIEHNQNLIDEGFTLVGKQMNRTGEYGLIPEGWSKPEHFFEHELVGLNSYGINTGKELVFLGGAFWADGEYFSDNLGLVYDCSGVFKEIRMPYDYTSQNTAVWSGTDILVFGGYDQFNWIKYPEIGPGYIYNVDSNTWTAMSTTNDPSPRYDAFSVWTGTEMIVWGGAGLDANNNNIFLSDGARYNPTTDTWTSMASNPNVNQNRIQKAIWTGTEMMLIDNYNNSYKYNPTTDTWTAMSTVGAPSAPRFRAAIVWTGSELIVYGGNNSNDPNSTTTGGRYNPATDTWTAMPAGGAPYYAVIGSIWDGSKIFMSGSHYDQGWIYEHNFFDPSTDTWTPIPTEPNKVISETSMELLNGTYLYFLPYTSYAGPGVEVKDAYTPAGTMGYNFYEKANYLYKKN